MLSFLLLLLFPPNLSTFVTISIAAAKDWEGRVPRCPKFVRRFPLWPDLTKSIFDFFGARVRGLESLNHWRFIWQRGTKGSITLPAPTKFQIPDRLTGLYPIGLERVCPEYAHTRWYNIYIYTERVGFMSHGMIHCSSNWCRVYDIAVIGVCSMPRLDDSFRIRKLSIRILESWMCIHILYQGWLAQFSKRLSAKQYVLYLEMGCGTGSIARVRLLDIIETKLVDQLCEDPNRGWPLDSSILTTARP